MKKLALMMLMIVLSMYGYGQCTFTYTSSCITLNSDGSETVAITPSFSCYGTTYTVYFWILKNIANYGSANTSDYIQASGTVTTTGIGPATLTFNISAANALPLTTCYDLWLLPNSTDRPWNNTPVSICTCDPFSSACYYVDPNGYYYVKLVAATNAYAGMFVWIADPATPGLYYGGPSTSATVFKDIDGVNWDYIYPIVPSYPINTSTYPCLTIYYGYTYTGAAPTSYDHSMTVCACSPNTAGFINGGCYSVVNGQYDFKLVLNGDEGAFYQHSIYFWTQTSGESTSAISSGIDADNTHYDYFFNFSSLDNNDFDANNCLTIYYSTNGALVGTTTIGDGVSSITICPCCQSFGNTNTIQVSTTNPMTIIYNSTIPGSWDFGDLHYGTGSGTHTYASASAPSYNVCVYTTTADPSPPGHYCTLCRNICISNSSITHSSGNCLPEQTYNHTCNSNFSVQYDGTENFTVIPDAQPVSYAYNSNEMYVYEYDTYQTNSTSYTFPSSGTHTICLKINIVDENDNVVCECSETCMTICSLDYPKTANVPNTLSAINGIELAPNPSNDKTTLSFSLENKTVVKIMVTDIVGQMVSKITEQFMTAGDHQVDISTSGFAPGLYNVSVQTDKGINTKRLSVIK